MEHERMVARVLAAIEHLGGGADARDVLDVLVVQDAPPRQYHTTTHLAEMWAEVDRLQGSSHPNGVPAVVDLAIAFHDVVYDPTSSDNEERSARRAGRFLGRSGLGAHAVDEVERLVHVTADHVADPTDLHAALVVDADLWVLSAPTARYDDYVTAVRTEYTHVPEADWRTGRIRVLDHLDGQLADTGYLVGDDGDRRARTARARANIARERATLAVP